MVGDLAHCATAIHVPYIKGVEAGHYLVSNTSPLQGVSTHPLYTISYTWIRPTECRYVRAGVVLYLVKHRYTQKKKPANPPKYSHCKPKYPPVEVGPYSAGAPALVGGTSVALPIVHPPGAYTQVSQPWAVTREVLIVTKMRFRGHCVRREKQLWKSK